MTDEHRKKLVKVAHESPHAILPTIFSNLRLN